MEGPRSTLATISSNFIMQVSIVTYWKIRSAHWRWIMNVGWTNRSSHGVSLLLCNGCNLRRLKMHLFIYKGAVIIPWRCMMTRSKIFELNCQWKWKRKKKFEVQINYIIFNLSKWMFFCNQTTVRCKPTWVRAFVRVCEDNPLSDGLSRRPSCNEFSRIQFDVENKSKQSICG